MYALVTDGKGRLFLYSTEILSRKKAKYVFDIFQRNIMVPKASPKALYGQRLSGTRSLLKCFVMKVEGRGGRALVPEGTKSCNI